MKHWFEMSTEERLEMIQSEKFVRNHTREHYYPPEVVALVKAARGLREASFRLHSAIKQGPSATDYADTEVMVTWLEMGQALKPFADLKE